MGDMADELIQNGFDNWLDGAYDDYVPQLIRCKYCGTDGFHWVNLDGKWCLADKEEKIHYCLIK